MRLTNSFEVADKGYGIHNKNCILEFSESEDLRVTIHERLGEVLSILKNILHQYPALQSTELFAASGSLITKVKCK